MTRERAAELIAAEAAETNGNTTQMHESLSRVPAEFRTQTWDSLDRRLHSADAVIDAPAGSPWVAMVPAPERPGVFYTLQNDGNVHLLDLGANSLSLCFNEDFSGPPSGLLFRGTASESLRG